MEKAFVEEGGYSEQLATARLTHRKKKDQSKPTDQCDQKAPTYPQCGALMALRTAKSGKVLAASSGAAPNTPTAMTPPPFNTMLDTDTNLRIDTARDILVGKVPDPKSQVERTNRMEKKIQATLACIWAETCTNPG